MFTYKKIFNSFSVDDIKKAKKFYNDALGMNVQLEGEMGMSLRFSSGDSVFIYPKENHQSATFTVLNFVVEDIDKELNHLIKNGIKFEHYHNQELPQDENGIMRGLEKGDGPDIAWFKDPAGNILSLVQEPS